MEGRKVNLWVDKADIKLLAGSFGLINPYCIVRYDVGHS